MEHEIIKSIQEVFGLRLGNHGPMNGANGSRLGMAQMLNLLGDGGSYDGYKVTTTQHEYLVLIENGQSCCEDWGYMVVEDETDRFAGKQLNDVSLVGTALNKEKISQIGSLDMGGIQFVNFSMSDGDVLQLAVYNGHNGYYGHSIIVTKDNQVLLNDTL